MGFSWIWKTCPVCALIGRPGFGRAGEALTAERAGEGNMNCVIRVKLPARSLILKQARPWVEKYPSIAAPIERASAEARFYRFAAQDADVAAMMPRCATSMRIRRS